MPLYDYKCPTCGAVHELITRMNDEHPPCTQCGRPMKRLLHARFGINMGAAGAHGYYDENLGCYINSNRQRREEMRRQGVTEKGDTPKPNGKAWI